MRDWKCYVTTTDRNLSWDHRDVTGLWGEPEPWAPYLAVIPGLYANDINSHPTPAGRRLTLICICSRVIGIGMERNEEWGRFWFCGVCGWQGWCLTGPCLGPSAEHDTIIPIVIFPPSSSAPHISRSQLSFSVDTQPQLVSRHNLTITNQMMITDSRRVWCEKKSVMCFDCSEPLWVHLKYPYHLPPPRLSTPLSPDSPIQNIQTDE